MLPRIRSSINRSDTTLSSFLSKFPKAKQEAYKQGYAKAVLNQRLHPEMEVMVKKKEVNKIDRNGNCGDRPRMINCQHPSQCLPAGLLNEIILKAVKTVMPEICHGKNCEEIQEMLNEIPSHWQSISTDGSGFDSTQHKEIIDCTDNFLIDNVFDETIHAMRRAGLEISQKMAAQLRKNILCLELPYFIRYKGKIIERGTISGTVFSGHATRTTLGNSIRQLSYIKFALRDVKFRYFVRVAGDDCIIFCHPKNLSKVKECLMRELFVTKNGDHGGLGQVCKIFNEGYNTADFLSKSLFRTSKGWSVCRLPDRAFISGLHHRLDNEIRTPEAIAEKLYTVKQARGMGMLSWGSATALFSRYKPDIIKLKPSYAEKLAKNPHVRDPQGLDWFFARYLGVNHAYLSMAEVDSSKPIHLHKSMVGGSQRTQSLWRVFPGWGNARSIQHAVVSCFAIFLSCPKATYDFLHLKFTANFFSIFNAKMQFGQVARPPILAIGMRKLLAINNNKKQTKRRGEKAQKPRKGVTQKRRNVQRIKIVQQPMQGALLNYSTKINAPMLRKMNIANVEAVSSLPQITGSFQILLQIDINPGQFTTSPWLSQIAKSFDMYSWRKLRFLYKTQVPATSPGQIIMLYYRDTTQVLPTTMKEVYANQVKTESPVWQDCAFSIPSQYLSREREYFVRSADQQVVDNKFYDVGKLVVICLNGSGIGSPGVILVDYNCELQTPVSTEPLGSFSSINTSATGASQADFLAAGTTTSNGVQDSIQISQTLGTFNAANFSFTDAGTYLLNYVQSNATSPTFSYGAGLAADIINSPGAATFGCIQKFFITPQNILDGVAQLTIIALVNSATKFKQSLTISKVG